MRHLPHFGHQGFVVGNGRAIDAQQIDRGRCAEDLGLHILRVGDLIDGLQVEVDEVMILKGPDGGVEPLEVPDLQHGPGPAGGGSFGDCLDAADFSSGGLPTLLERHRGLWSHGADRVMNPENVFRRFIRAALLTTLLAGLTACIVGSTASALPVYFYETG